MRRIVISASAISVAVLVVCAIHFVLTLDNQHAFVWYLALSGSVVTAAYITFKADSVLSDKQGRRAMIIFLISGCLYFIWVLQGSFIYNEKPHDLRYIKGFIHAKGVSSDDENMADDALFDRYSNGLPSRMGDSWNEVSIILNQVAIAGLYLIQSISFTAFICYVLMQAGKLMPDRQPSIEATGKVRTVATGSENVIPDVETTIFDVAFSFPGTIRPKVEEILAECRRLNNPLSIFYDLEFRGQLARPSSDLLLQSIYKERSRLVVVFLSAGYKRSEWCGLEFNVIRDMVKKRQYEKIMYVRTDDTEIEGILSTDGFVDIRQHSSSEIAVLIEDRLLKMKN